MKALVTKEKKMKEVLDGNSQQTKLSKAKKMFGDDKELLMLIEITKVNLKCIKINKDGDSQMIRFQRQGMWMIREKITTGITPKTEIKIFKETKNSKLLWK